MNTFVARRIV